jgi:hypothetical protein
VSTTTALRTSRSGKKICINVRDPRHRRAHRLCLHMVPKGTTSPYVITLLGFAIWFHQQNRRRGRSHIDSHHLQSLRCEQKCSKLDSSLEKRERSYRCNGEKSNPGRDPFHAVAKLLSRFPSSRRTSDNAVVQEMHRRESDLRRRSSHPRGCSTCRP